MHYRTLVMSDFHLGSPDSQYQEILKFLKENTCDHLILNGDIVDGRFLRVSRNRPKKHTQVIQKILDLSQSGTKITYLYGNHDSLRNNLSPLSLQGIDIREDLVYQSGEKTYYICHGQQFDKQTKNAVIEWAGFLAGMLLFRINRTYNKWRRSRGLKYKSIIRGIKGLAKILMTGGRKKFEENLITLTNKHKTDGLICGHIHRPEMSKVGEYDYFNCGDRVESCTALGENEKNERTLIQWKR